MKTNVVYVWPDGAWVWASEFNKHTHAHKGNEYFVVEVKKHWDVDTVDAAVMEYISTGILPIPKQEVKSTLEFLPVPNKINVILHPSGEVICEVYATKGEGYKADYKLSRSQGLLAPQVMEIQKFILGLNSQLKTFTHIKLEKS